MVLIFRYYCENCHDTLSIAIDQLCLSRQEQIIDYQFEKNHLNKNDFKLNRVDIEPAHYDRDKDDRILKLENDIKIISEALLEITDKEGSDYGFENACNIAEMYTERS